ncbi:MAG: hypothetical protein ACW99V_08795, partial [Candidatus Thorarchaeota archaeon]
NLTALGYNAIWVEHGLNSSILENADALMLGSVYHTGNGFREDELNAITDWFATGHKFIWIGADSDFEDVFYGKWGHDNMTNVLERIGSHVYPEPSHVWDSVSNCGSEYQVIATNFSTDPFLADIGKDLNRVLMHGPTCLYLSLASSPKANLSISKFQDASMENVYPVLSYSVDAYLVDTSPPDPLLHTMDDHSPMVACTMEIHAGISGTGVIVVSGNSPYADYRPMCQESYYGVNLDGHVFVRRLIDFSVNFALSDMSDIPDLRPHIILFSIAGIAIISIAYVVRSRRIEVID